MSARALACVLAIFFASAAIPADNGGPTGQKTNGADTSKQSSPAADDAPRAACLKQCTSSEVRCGREVRQARSECSRNAANGGRDPFSGRADYSYFCSYFEHPERHCGAGTYSNACLLRLGRRHGVCLTAMENVASLRYDCIRSERDAVKQCREELRDCKAACR